MTEPPVKRNWFHLDRDTRWQIGAAAVLGMVCLGGLWLADVLEEPYVPSGGDAGLACQTFVKDHLKAPATADFSNVRHSGSSPTWTVTGAVDAENSFRATLRMDWTCKVRLDGGTFVLESLTGLR